MKTTKETKIIIWLIGVIILAYFIFLPIEIKREKPKNISPLETTTEPYLEETTTE